MSEASRGAGRIGVLVPFTNVNLEADMAMLCPPGVSMHFARLGGYDVDEIPDEAQMAGLGAADLGEPLRLLLGVKPDVVMYGCTSATLSHGQAFDRDLSETIRSRSGAVTVTAAGALIHALQALGAERIAFASPYVASLNDLAIAFLAEAGVQTVSRADWPEPLGNYGQGALAPDQVHALGVRADSDKAEVLVLSCTDMRSVETVDRLEGTLGKPVICSNQAMLFQALSLAGIPPGRRVGTLMARHL